MQEEIKNKIIKYTIAVLSVMIINTMVNISDNIYLGLRYPQIYFPIVIVGMIGSIIIQIYGAHKIIERYYYERRN